MLTSTAIRRAVRYALLTSAAAGAAVPAFAADQTIQEVVVTGSRIAQPNLETTSPITQVTSEDVITQGVTKVEDLINQLPQAFAAQNGTVSNGSTGTATVNLRGLGSNRTLVLIDGRRMPYGGVTNSAADLNQIPTALVERVEVLTGGASAVYGSDAVAGVVNFIMKKDFEGVQFDGQYSLYQHNNDFGGPGAVKLRDVVSARSATNPAQFQLPDDNVTDGNGVQGTLMVGVSTEDGRGNITAYASYQESKPILQRDRDYSACALDTVAPTTSFACGGSSTAFPGRFTDLGANSNANNGPDGKPNTADDVPDTNPLPTYNSSLNANAFRPFSSTTDQYNFGPTNYYLRPDTRYSLGAMGHYELAPFADLYTQLMFTDVRSVAQIAPGGIFIGDTSTINCDNPFLSAQQATTIGCGAPAQLAATTIDPATITPDNPTGSPFLADPNVVPLYIGRRNVEGGGRQQDFHNSSFRGLIGARGDIAEGWSYDVSTQFSRTSANQLTLNFFSIPKISNALDAVRDPETGNIVCRSVAANPSCVPYNVFSPGGVTPATLNYIQAPGIQVGTIDQNVTQGVITGDLGTIGAKLPWADESIKIAFGVENRRDKLQNTPDDLQAQGLLSGSGGATIGISGSTNVNDVFMEASIPLVQGKPFAERLTFDTAYRYSDYSSGTTTDTYKLGMDWAPVEDIRFRASFQRAVRAPNIVELFTAQGFNLFDMPGDPCGQNVQFPQVRPGQAAPPPPAASLAECVATGMPQGQFGSANLDSPAGQYQLNQGGNTALQPETSDTISYGIVFTPRFAPGLSVSVDYFDIQVEDLISTFGSINTLDACYKFNDATACSRIHRNATGALWLGDGNVDDLNTNIGGLETSGVDLNLNYAGLDLGSWGSLNFNLTATHLIELVTDPGAAGFPKFDCVGLFAGNCTSSLTTAVNPQVRTRFRIGWETPWSVDLALTHRYISSVSQDDALANAIDRHLPHESYFDLFGGWAMTDSAQVRLGINNLLDDDPSINASVGTTGNGNTFPQVYEALGRFIFGGVTVKF